MARPRPSPRPRRPQSFRPSRPMTPVDFAMWTTMAAEATAEVPGAVAETAADAQAIAGKRVALALLYAGVLVTPLLLIAGVPKPGAQGKLVIFGDALGFAALSLIVLQVLA